MNPRDRKQFKKHMKRYLIENQAFDGWSMRASENSRRSFLTWLPRRIPRLALSLAASKRETAKELRELASESVSPFVQLNELLALGTLTVSLENSNDEEILARHGNDGVPFSIAQMSDGERNAVMIAANVLTVEPETILLIDEPERHLHRAIIEPFLSALFEQRPDCAFVISTHEIALPVANPEADVLMVRSCRWAKKAEEWPNGMSKDSMGCRKTRRESELARGTQAGHLGSQTADPFRGRNQEQLGREALQCPVSRSLGDPAGKLS